MHTISHAVVIFVDVRGFTSWSQHVDVHQYLEEFLSSCYANLKKVFEGAYIKTLGDGAMMILECPIPQSKEEVTDLLDAVLLKICHVENHFRETCDMFSWQRGHRTQLRLGWGVTRGIVLALSREDLDFADFVGPNINLCSRLCYLARPAGIVIAQEDFPLLPHLPDDPWGQSCTVLERTFQPEEHHVNGVQEAIPVWSLLTLHEPSPSRVLAERVTESARATTTAIVKSPV